MDSWHFKDFLERTVHYKGNKRVEWVSWAIVLTLGPQVICARQLIYPVHPSKWNMHYSPRCSSKHFLVACMYLRRWKFSHLWKSFIFLRMLEKELNLRAVNWKPLTMFPFRKKMNKSCFCTLGLLHPIVHFYSSLFILYAWVRTWDDLCKIKIALIKFIILSF